MTIYDKIYQAKAVVIDGVPFLGLEIALISLDQIHGASVIKADGHTVKNRFGELSNANSAS